MCNESPVQVRCSIQNVWGWCTWMTQRDVMGREMGGRLGWETHVHPWRIHVNVWQNQYNIEKEKKKKLNELKKKKKAVGLPRRQ